MSMRYLRPALALLPFVWATSAFADPPPVIFPTAPIVNQPQVQQVQAPQQPAVQVPVAQAPAQVHAPVAAPVQAPQAPAQPYVAQPQQVAAPQAPVMPQQIAAQPGQFQANAAPAAAPMEPQRPWLAPSTPGPQPVAGAEAGPSPWRIFSVLFFVVLIGGAALYVKQAKGAGAMTAFLGKPASSGLRVVDSARVGPRAQIVVAEFNGRRFLIGVNDTSIRRLAYLGRSEPTRSFADSRAPMVAPQDDAPIDVPAPQGGFTDAMRRALAQSASLPVAPVQPSHPVATTPSAPSVNAADLLASETRDVVDLGVGARMNRVLASRDTATSPRPSDVYTRTPGPSNVEEQVAGLTRRRIPRRG
jgi:hypothetical protein